MNKIAYIGRFQPAHLGHVDVVKQALEAGYDEVHIILGSSFRSRSTKNPLTVQERVEHFRELLYNEEVALNRIKFHAIEDLLYIDALRSDYCTSKKLNQVWADEVVDKILDTTGITDVVYHNKGGDSDYLKEVFSACYTLWEPEPRISMNATDIRKDLYELNLIDVDLITNVMRGFLVSDELDILISEYKALKADYEDTAANYAWPASLNVACADVLITALDSTMLLAGVRGGKLGKGKLALPGGHKDSNETFLDCALREGKEETGLDLANDDEVLILASMQCDSPSRWTMTPRHSVAFLMEYGDEQPLLDAVAMSAERDLDDIESLRTVDINSIDSTDFYADHYDIIKAFWNIDTQVSLYIS